MLRTTFTAALAAIACASDDVSREGRDLSFVIMLNAPALSSPKTSLNLAVDSAQESKYANRITPVGQRQQFLIGSELRRRYVDEAKLLSPEYNIAQIYLRAPFVAKNILSLQAQMMGLYPSTHQNDLTEWQQKNAVPPLEGVDFSKWQEELGASALPYGLQTFPIPQSGFEADTLLSMDKRNCALYGDLISPFLESLSETLNQTVADQYPDIASQLQESQTSSEELCDYLTWARFNAVKLQGDSTRQEEYKRLVKETCPDYYGQVTEAVLQVNKSNKNLVASEFMTNIVNRVNVALTYSSTESNGTNDLPLAMTNYQAFTPDILLSVAQATLVDAPTETLPASSSLLFEVGKDDTIRGYLNDEEYTVIGCEQADVCTADLFLAALEASIGYSDLQTACAPSDDGRAIEF